MNSGTRKALEAAASKIESEITRLNTLRATQQSALDETSGMLNNARTELAEIVEDLNRMEAASSE